MRYLLFVGLLLFSGCKVSEKQSVAFDILSKLTEAKIKELLRYEGVWRKDSINVTVQVPRAHCRKVLGKKLNSFVTRRGGAALIKEDLQISLSWNVLKDTSKVWLKFEKYAKN